MDVEVINQIMAISVKEYQKRLQPILSLQAMKQLVDEIILSDNEKLKAQKIKEFELGLRPDGNRIGTYRDPDYAEYKLQQNPLADGYVDLLLTYRTARSLFVRIENKGYIFGINDVHNLVGRYGQDILGLNQEWFNKRQEDIYKLVLVFQIKKKYKIA